MVRTILERPQRSEVWFTLDAGKVIRNRNSWTYKLGSLGHLIRNFSCRWRRRNNSQEFAFH